MSPRAVDEAFDRLQHLLLAMHTGDELLVSDAAARTGLAVETCLTVLERLTAAGLMSRGADGRFVRRRLETLGV